MGYLLSCLKKAAGRASPVPSLGHIQIAQVPGRHEPNSPGELNFPYLFELLESLGYTGYVGCEYAPKGEWACGLWAVGAPLAGPSMDQLAGDCKGRRVLGWMGSGHWDPYLGIRALPKTAAAPACLGVPAADPIVTAVDTLEGLGWLRSYWESRGLQHSGTSKAAE